MLNYVEHQSSTLVMARFPHWKSQCFLAGRLLVIGQGFQQFQRLLAQDARGVPVVTFNDTAFNVLQGQPNDSLYPWVHCGSLWSRYQVQSTFRLCSEMPEVEIYVMIHFCLSIWQMFDEISYCGSIDAQQPRNQLETQIRKGTPILWCQCQMILHPLVMKHGDGKIIYIYIYNIYLYIYTVYLYVYSTGVPL